MHSLEIDLLVPIIYVCSIYFYDYLISMLIIFWSKYFMSKQSVMSIIVPMTISTLQGGPKKWVHLVAYYAIRCSHFFWATLYVPCPFHLYAYSISMPIPSLCPFHLLPILSLCPFHLYAHSISMPISSLCPFHLYAHSISMPISSLCPFHLYSHFISMPIPSLCPFHLYTHFISMPIPSLCPFHRFSHSVFLLSVSSLCLVVTYLHSDCLLDFEVVWTLNMGRQEPNRSMQNFRIKK